MLTVKTDAPDPDQLEQAKREVQQALAVVDAAMRTAVEAYLRFRALAGAEPAMQQQEDPYRIEPARTGTQAPASDRQYVPGPLPPDWQHVSKLAKRLGGMHETTAWRVAFAEQAQWPYGSSRKVDMSKFPLLPDPPKHSRLAT